MQPLSLVSVDASAEEDMTSPLSLLMEKERKMPDVSTGSRKRKQAAIEDEECFASQQVEVRYMVMFRDDNEVCVGNVTGVSL